MTINDDDKKFIKDTINDAIDSKLESYEAKTESKQRLNELKKEKQEKEDRKALIAELRDRDKKGENTLAQKMELLKLSVDNVIPKDVKNALSAAGKGVQSGASQIGSGISHLTGKAMMTNPLTALLWQNRDIFKALGDIGIGGLKVGASVLGGATGAVFGALGSLFNKGKRDSQEDTEPKESKKKKVVTIGKGDKVEVVEENEGAAALLEEKKNWKKQIDEIHKEVTQDLKDATRDRKSGNMILSKGLDGLKGSMDKVKEFTSEIASKSKAILAGVLLAGVGILALVAVMKTLPGLLNKKNDNTRQKWKNPNTGSNMGGDELTKFFNDSNLGWGKVDGSKTTKQYLDFKNGGMTNKAPKGDEEYYYAGKTYQGQGMLKILAPFDGFVMHLKPLTKIKNGKQEEMSWEMTIRPKDHPKGIAATTKMKGDIVFSNVLGPMFGEGHSFKKGWILGYSKGSIQARNAADHKSGGFGVEHFMGKDYDEMYEQAEANDFKDNIKGTVSGRTEKVIKELKEEQSNKITKSAHRQNKGVKNDVIDVLDGVSEKIDNKKHIEQTEGAHYDDKGNLNIDGEKATLNITGTNLGENNLQKQNETIASLNKKEEVVKPQVINEPTVDSKENNTIAVNVENPIDVKWPTLLNLGEVNVALQNDYEIS